jgi:hypothetical protein
VILVFRNFHTSLERVVVVLESLVKSDLVGFPPSVEVLVEMALETALMVEIEVLEVVERRSQMILPSLVYYPSLGFVRCRM